MVFPGLWTSPPVVVIRQALQRNVQRMQRAMPRQVGEDVPSRWAMGGDREKKECLLGYILGYMIYIDTDIYIYMYLDRLDR